MPTENSLFGLVNSLFSRAFHRALGEPVDFLRLVHCGGGLRLTLLRLLDLYDQLLDPLADMPDIPVLASRSPRWLSVC